MRQPCAVMTVRVNSKAGPAAMWLQALPSSLWLRALVMEEAHVREAHGNAVLVGGLDYVVVADGAARLDDVGDA